jgi:hypothetical protein
MQNDPQLAKLIDRAEASLAAHLATAPGSKHKQLSQFYAELRAGTRRARYPTARDLFWDTPQTAAEEQCINDALAVFRFANGKAATCAG